MPGPSDSVPRLRHSARNRRAAICAALLVVCGFGDARAEIRIWVDASGVTHFSDDPERAPDASTSLEGEGASLSPRTERDFTGLAFTGLASHLETPLQLTGKLITEPSFPQAEIDQAIKSFSFSSDVQDVVVLPLFGSLPPEEQDRIMQFDGQCEEGQRMVVFTTNVAETSLTIPGVKLVVDVGLAKEVRYDQARLGFRGFEPAAGNGQSASR